MDMRQIYAAADATVKTLSHGAREILRLRGKLPNADDPKGKVAQARTAMLVELIQAGLVCSYRADTTATTKGQPFHRMEVTFTRMGEAFADTILQEASDP